MAATKPISITLDLTDLDSIAEAVRAGLTTIEQVAEYLDIELVDDCLVLPGTPVVADDGNAPVEYDADTDPADAARQYVDDGDWGTIESTTWVHVSTWRVGIDADGDETDVGEGRHTITLEPEEPDCLDGEGHIWKTPIEIVGGIKENPGVWGIGGGVICSAVCVRCGCTRTEDSWATDPSNGTQGHSSTSYEEGGYADEVAEMHLRAAVSDLSADEDGGDYTYEHGGYEHRADREQMIEYGRAVVCDEPANLPGDVVEDDTDAD